MALGLAIYLLSYGPMITRILPNGDELVESGSTLPIDLGLLAALLAGVSVLPKAKNFAAVVAAVAVLGGLLLIEDTIGASGRGWALWFALGCGVIQAILAVTALLLDAGVITPPAPRPKYDQYGHYGQYGGYYGQQSALPVTQQSGYGSQYGGYPSGPSTGGFSAVGPRPDLSTRSRDRSTARRRANNKDRPPRQRVSPASARRRPPAPAWPGSGKLREPRRFRPRPALVRPGAAATDAVVAVGPVTVLTVRSRARRVAGRGT